MVDTTPEASVSRVTLFTLPVKLPADELLRERFTLFPTSGTPPASRNNAVIVALPLTTMDVCVLETPRVPLKAEPLMVIETDPVADKQVAVTVAKGPAAAVNVTVALPLESVFTAVVESEAFVGSVEKDTIAPETSWPRLSITVAVMTVLPPAVRDEAPGVSIMVAGAVPEILIFVLTVALPSVAAMIATAVWVPAVKVTVALPFVVT